MGAEKPELRIEIRNWERFQHYSDRQPNWIKNYLELLHDDNYRDLTMAERGVLHGLWLEYASARRALRGDTASISRRLGQRVTSMQLKRLNDAGWIDLRASTALARAGARAREKEKELKEKPQPKPNPIASYDAGLEKLEFELPAALRGDPRDDR